MKRFYKNASVEAAAHGFHLLLDGKPVKTPGRESLTLPTHALAEKIAQEWREQGDEIVPQSMPLTRLANTVQDGVARAREEVIAAILCFGEHDLICYRAEDPLLAARQREAWDPMLGWAFNQHGAQLRTASGLMHVAQLPEALAQLKHAVAAKDDYALAALHVMASITGSLVLGLALAECAINPAQAFQMSRLDEDYQAERWGTDTEAEVRARALAREMDVALAFLAASRD